MSARKKQAIVLTFLVAGGALVLLGRLQNPEMGRFIGVPYILIGLVLEVALFRCPHCGRRLGKSFRPGRHCPYCGEIID